MIAAYITMVFIGLSLPFLIFRLIRGPNWSDRIIACDMLGVYMIAGLLALESEFHWEWDRDVIWLMLALSLVTVIGPGLLLEETNRG